MYINFTLKALTHNFYLKIIGYLRNSNSSSTIHENRLITLLAISCCVAWCYHWRLIYNAICYVNSPLQTPTFPYNSCRVEKYKRYYG